MAIESFTPHEYHADIPCAAVVLRWPDRPLTPADVERLEEDICAIEDDCPQAVAILRGSGKSCAGLDCAAFSAEGTSSRLLARAEKLWRHWDKLPNFKLAAVEGQYTGLAATMALGSDLCLMDSQASLAWDEIRHGLTAGIAAWLLPRLIGLGHARGILLTGRAVTAAEAERWGLAHRVFCGGDDLERQLAELLGQLSRLTASSRQATRQLLRETWGMAYENAIGVCLAAQARCLNHPEG